MGEIKFRAWDDQGSKSKMHYPGDKTFDDTSLVLNFHGDILEARKLHAGNNTPQDAYEHSVYPARIGHNFTLMQYTGLKDKNGVEIYEGDILATANDGSDGADVWEQEILGDVYWNDKFACWNHRADLHDDDSIYNLNKYVYVIGNIHENPELLK